MFTAVCGLSRCRGRPKQMVNSAHSKSIKKNIEAMIKGELNVEIKYRRKLEVGRIAVLSL